MSIQWTGLIAAIGNRYTDALDAAKNRRLVRTAEALEVDDTPQAAQLSSTPPQLGERALLLILSTKEERINMVGDLEEEYRRIAAKHGARYANLWYYKQVVGSAWPVSRKALGWGLLTSVGAWIRRYI
jgi:hypothetical protein